VTLRVENLSVRYGAVQAVRGVSFTVSPGEIVGLIGANGAGKSSTLHAIMGAAPVTGGEIGVAGTSLRGRRPEDVARSGVALVPEGRRIFAELTVEENLRLGFAARRSRGDEASVLRGVYELFPIVEEFRRRQAGVLSGGQQQQLAIARALAAQPRLLILDEPTEGIQPSIIKDIGRVIRMLADEGINGQKVAILLVEQYYDFARELADDYLVMERGEFIARGLGAEMETNGVRQLVAI
jgi:urea transport system ATP-binding protein